MLKKYALPALALALVPAAAQAANEVTTGPIESDGKQIGCEISFVVDGADRSSVAGSLNFMMTSSKTPIYALKLGVSEAGQSSNAAPATAYLLDGDTPTTSAFTRRIDSDTKGYALFAFSVDEPVMNATISAPAQKRQIRFNYQMREGGKTMVGVIPFEGDQGLRTVGAWLDCLKKVVG